MSVRGAHWLMVAAVVVVLAAVGAGLAVMDSPAHERAERLDRKRVEHLQHLAQRIDAHFDVHDALPASLAVVDGPPGTPLVDPATGRPYAYEATGERRYRLCAEFGTESGGSPHPVPYQHDWRHSAGRQCFDREVRDVVHPGTPVPARPAPPARGG